MERNSVKKWSFTGLAQALWSLWLPLHSTLSSFLFNGMVRNGIPRVCFYFCSTARNSELFSLSLKSSEGNSASLLLFWFHGTEFRVVFSSAEGLGREFWDFDSILFNGTEFRVVFSSTEGFGKEFRELSVPRNSRNSVGNNHLFRLFRLPRNYFLSEIPNPSVGVGEVRICQKYLSIHGEYVLKNIYLSEIMPIVFGSIWRIQQST